MERNEFNEWLQKHQKAYPALADWFASLADTKGTLQIWFDAMKFVQKAHADEATMRMIRGVEPLVRYTNWHDTPRFVSEHAECLKREAKPRKKWVFPEANGEEVFACIKCRDTGVVEVFHGKHVKQARKGVMPRSCFHKSARACECGTAKKRYGSMIERGDLPIFNIVSDVLTPQDRRCCACDTVEQDADLILASDVNGEMSLDAWVAAQ
jgi:hypothetical protein